MGKKTSKTTSTTTPWQPAQPYILGAANTIQNTVNEHQPQLDSLTNNLVGQLPGMWNQAMDTSAIQPGLDYSKSVLGGNYLNSNPYVQQQAQFAGNDAANHVNATFSMAGRTGSQDHAYSLSKGVTAAEMPILNQNYQNERNNQTAVAGQLPGLNASRFAGYTPALAATQLAGQLPYYGNQSLATMGSLFSPYTSTVGTQQKSFMDYLAAAAAAAGQAATMGG